MISFKRKWPRRLKARQRPVYNLRMEVYVLDIAALRGREEEALARLTPSRREKALRLRNPEARLRSAAAGLLLRRYIGDGPFVREAGGKPCIPGGPCFSLSHSGSYALLAVDGARLGADIEPMAPPRPALAARVLSAEELRWMAGDEARRFAYLWTRKEAALKWDGCGVAYPLRDVCVLPGERPVVNGRGCALYSAEYRGYWISAAGDEPCFVPRTVTWEEVMS